MQTQDKAPHITFTHSTPAAAPTVLSMDPALASTFPTAQPPSPHQRSGGAFRVPTSGYTPQGDQWADGGSGSMVRGQRAVGRDDPRPSQEWGTQNPEELHTNRFKIHKTLLTQVLLRQGEEVLQGQGAP